MIDAVGVVVPARNEAGHIEACLESIKVALDALPLRLDTAIWVVVDRSTDDTARIVERVLAGRPRCGWAISRGAHPVGRLRHHGALEVLCLLRRHTPARTWLLSTDADSEVPADWAARHLRYASQGAHAVAGVVRLSDLNHLHPRTLRRYQGLLASERAMDHAQVYGATLGVRADAYLAVGGFAARATGEDGDLVNRLVDCGFQVSHRYDVYVSTSARLDGRASGGLADLLGQMQREALQSQGSSSQLVSRELA
jgi:glycosyltransferase involved in cell wall biosynthesis